MGAARRAFLSRCLILLALLIAGLPSLLAAQEFEKPVHELAQKIVAASGAHGSMTLELRNNSSISPGDVARVRRALETEIRKTGVKLVPAPPGDAVVRVTLAENLQGYLWVAEIQRGGEQRLAMVSVARGGPGAQSAPAPTLVLRKQLVFQQSEQILDFAQLPLAPDGMPRLLVLEPERIRFYRFEGSRWQFQEAGLISHENPWPRDLRGHLKIDEDTFEAYLPGVPCSGVVRRNLTMKCGAEVDINWPFTAGGEERGTAPFTPERNYFTGFLTTYGENKLKLPPFFSSAMLKFPDTTHWILTGLDGEARLYDDSTQPAATFSGWGSDIAAIGSGCDATWQVLVTRPGDWTQRDAIEAVEIIDRQAAADSQPVEFDGPVTALWPATDGKSASAVVRNRKTGQYEAYTLSISCSQ